MTFFSAMGSPDSRVGGMKHGEGGLSPLVELPRRRSGRGLFPHPHSPSKTGVNALMRGRAREGALHTHTHTHKDSPSPTLPRKRGRGRAAYVGGVVAIPWSIHQMA